MQRKFTDIDLVDELVRRNDDGRYDKLIEKARGGIYHDFKGAGRVTDPKVELVRDLRKFPELNDILVDVLNCDYDESDNTAEDIEDVEVTLTE